MRYLQCTRFCSDLLFGFLLLAVGPLPTQYMPKQEHFVHSSSCLYVEESCCEGSLYLNTWYKHTRKGNQTHKLAKMASLAVGLILEKVCLCTCRTLSLVWSFGFGHILGSGKCIIAVEMADYRCWVHAFDAGRERERRCRKRHKSFSPMSDCCKISLVCFFTF